MKKALINVLICYFYLKHTTFLHSNINSLFHIVLRPIYRFIQNDIIWHLITILSVIIMSSRKVFLLLFGFQGVEICIFVSICPSFRHDIPFCLPRFLYRNYIGLHSFVRQIYEFLYNWKWVWDHNLAFCSEVVHWGYWCTRNIFSDSRKAVIFITFSSTFCMWP